MAERRMTVTAPPPNRYSPMASPDDVKKWYTIFRTFDRDGGGDVDLRELGLMFRQVGQSPTEREMKLLIEEVDSDRSGTVDFEEFCLLMLRQQRAELVPDWMYEMLKPPRDAEAPPSPGGPLALPAHAALADEKFEAARRIQRIKKHGMHKVKRSAAAQKAEAPLGMSPEPMSRELLLTVVDMLPSAEHVRVAQISGHGPMFGPFIAEELAWRLATSSRTQLESIELAFNAIGDQGAEALAKTIQLSKTLTSIDVSGNGITMKGASAIHRALCAASSGILRTVIIDENPITEQMHTTIQVQLLHNQIPRIVESGVQPRRPGLSAKAAAWLEIGFSVESPPGGGMDLAAQPEVRLQEEWLSSSHVPSLRRKLNEVGIKSLELYACPNLTDSAVASLLGVSGQPAAATPPAPANALGFKLNRPPPPPPPKPITHSFLNSVMYLRLSCSDLGDGAAAGIAAAAEAGSLAIMRGLALDGNAIGLEASGMDLELGEPSSLALRLGAALRGLRRLEQLDLSCNTMLHDWSAAALVGALLDPTPHGEAEQGGAEAGAAAPSLRALHLGGSGAGNRTAAACADAIGSAGSLLACICLGTEVGDQGAGALASALPNAPSIRELWIGNKVGDMGVEKLAAAIREPTCALVLLGLGGPVRGGLTVSNRLGPDSAKHLANAITRAPDGKLGDLRLSGNDDIGSEACLRLVCALTSVSSLHSLRLDGCGWRKESMRPLVEAVNEIYCLHYLTVEDKRPTIRGTAPPKLLGLQQRLALAKVLEDNKKQGKRRVESWRLAKSLEEVAWVFSSLCAGMTPSQVDAGPSKWDGATCAQLVTNLGLPQYAASFEFNLSGETLQGLAMSSLSELGVKSHEHQKSIMAAVRDLTSAFDRKGRMEKANARWDALLMGPGGGALAQRKKEESAEQLMDDEAIAQQHLQQQRLREKKLQAQRKREAAAAAAAAAGVPPISPAKQRAVSPRPIKSRNRQRSRSSGQVSPPAQRAGGGGGGGGGGVCGTSCAVGAGAAAAGAAGGAEAPLPPLIDQPWRAETVGLNGLLRAKRGLSAASSAALLGASASSAAARQAGTAVAGSQLRPETRELFRGLMHTIDSLTSPSAAHRGAGGSAACAVSGHGVKGGGFDLGATYPPRSAGGNVGAAAFGAAAALPFRGACETALAVRYGGAVSDVTSSASRAALPSGLVNAPSMPRLNPPVRSASSHGLRRGRVHLAPSSSKPSTAADLTSFKKSKSHGALPTRAANGANDKRSRTPQPSPSQPPQPASFHQVANASRSAMTPPPNSLSIYSAAAKDRSVKRTEAALDERLASASATLQSIRMASIVDTQPQPLSPPPRRPLSRSAFNGTLSASQFGRDIKQVGKRTPTSNDRLSLILSDLMVAPEVLTTLSTFPAAAGS